MKKKTKLMSFAAFTLSFVSAITTFKGNTPVNAATDKYLEDFVIIDAANLTEAQNKAATLQGYSVAEGTLYKNSSKGKYVACKYTNDSSKALTDIRAMNMYGGYSTEAYEKALEDRKDEAEAIIDKLYDSVKVVREGYATSKQTDGVDGIEYCYDLLSCYQYDDKTNPATNAPYTIAELITDQSISVSDLKKDLQTIVMQGNTKYVAGIEMALMHAATSSDGALNFTPLADENLDYTDYDVDEDFEEAAAYMAAGVEAVQDLLKPATNSPFKPGTVTDNNDEEFTQYFDNLSAEDKTDYYSATFIYIALSSFKYHHDDTTENLADFFINLDVNDDDFDNKIFYPFVEKMNDAQIGCLPYAGLDTLVIATLNKAGAQGVTINGTTYTFNYATLDHNFKAEGNSDVKVSVFEGIDRQVYTADGIALTNSALRQNNSKNDYNWFSEEKAEDKEVAQLAQTILKYAGITCGAACVGFVLSTLTVIYNIDTIIYLAPELAETSMSIISKVLIKEIAFAEQEGWLDVYFLSYGLELGRAKLISSVLSIGLKIMKFTGVLAILSLAIVIIAVIIWQLFEWYSEQPVEYETIPEIMVDETTVDNKAVYSNYYVVKDENGEAQTTSFYNELGETQWIALYKTRDENRGNPILAKDLRLTGFDSKDDETEYTAVRKFGETSKYDVRYFSEAGHSKLYLGYKTEDTSNTGSIFSSSVGLPLICGFLGLALGAVGGIFSFKFVAKKKEQ